MICHDEMMCVLCAGLIIDAFGELRDQQEQVREDMEVKLLLIYFHSSLKNAKCHLNLLRLQ